ncbi:LytTR family DNA-binding domain-containing protein [Halosquirtibacter xylanolyticus]|uniref:LytR/AlgR family response regulator transcription factor n=1 Tax=Halosquirtibacter xylanolyticus TaxID=3374599 RepID=UPI003748195C|nr:LytTR family DNA-binding domain-containing protein [Prolixibacteraceae bacterium]
MKSCIIIDDEHLARRLIQGYVSKTPNLEVKETFDNAIDAITYLQSNTVDLIFLDIHMPNITGLEFIKTIQVDALIIITSAFSEYAIDGFDHDVFDYLLKPIAFPRFLKATTKALEFIEANPEGKPIEENIIQKTQKDYLTIKADHRLYKINFNDIIFIEGQREYVTFHTKKRKVTAYYSLKSLIETLPADQFIRIHKSYIVSIPSIETLEGNMLEVGGQKLPIGKSYKSSVMDIFQ